jgi:TonB family protein
MSEIWKRWEGQVVDHKYRLESLIGNTDHSVVFQAEYHGPEPRRATLKFVAADSPSADQLIVAWNKAAQLSHPNLLRILQTGKCRMEDVELLYVAMECADENLAEIIPQRALTEQETREALNAIVDVLVYLHGKGLTHGHVCPANILAIGDFLKISSDTIEPLAEKREMTRERSEYDAPEIPAARYTQAADVWSLGVTLVEMLTQQRAALPFKENVDPVIPEGIREPFLSITRHALRRKPESRWTSAQIAERLNPSTIAARAAAAGASAPATSATPPASVVTTGATIAPTPQSASAVQPITAMPRVAPQPPRVVAPLSVPLSKEPAVPLSKQPRPPAPPVHVTVPGPKPARRESLVLPNYALPLFLGVLILVGVIALPKILRNGTETKSNPVSASAPVKSTPPVETAKPSASRAEASLPPSPSPKETARESTPPPRSASATLSPAPAVMRSTESAPAVKPRNSSDAQGRGEVLDQALPQVSAKALSTINGTVRVVVKTHVDAAGQVADAQLQEPGPSRYFADKAVHAAQRWVFSSPEVNGRSVESDWLIRFEYTRDGVKAFPQQVTP